MSEWLWDFGEMLFMWPFDLAEKLPFKVLRFLAIFPAMCIALPMFVLSFPVIVLGLFVSLWEDA